MNLRPYQCDAVAAIRSAFGRGAGRQVLVLPTGAGKTVVFAALASEFAQRGRVLVLVHREELAAQAAEKIGRWDRSLRVGVEMAASRAAGARLIVGSVATLGRKGSPRLTALDPASFSLLITDEAHHATSASYLAIYEHFGVAQGPRPGLLHLGCTATPNRTDGRPLSEVFDQIAYQMTLREAIAAGWLSDLRALRVAGGADLSGLATRAGDLAQDALSAAVNNPARNRLAVEAWRANAPERRTLAFAVDIQHALDLAAMFRASGVAAEPVWGDDPDRAAKIARYRSGEIPVLVNCAIATEGFDDPLTSCVLLARPTKSRVLYTQMVGRCTRLDPGVTNRLENGHGSKRDALVIDIADNAGRHSLAGAGTLFGFPARFDFEGRSISESARAVERKAAELPAFDPSRLARISDLAAAAKACDLFHDAPPPEIGFARMVWQRRATGGFGIRLRDGQWARVTETVLGTWLAESGRADAVTRGQDCATLRQAIATAESWVRSAGGGALFARNASWRQRPASEAQLRLLKRLGIRLSREVTMGEASAAIDAVKSRA